MLKIKFMYRGRETIGNIVEKFVENYVDKMRQVERAPKTFDLGEG